MTSALPTHLPDSGLAISTQGVSKQFRSRLALRGLDLQVPMGGVYVLVGPNGAGKTTAIRILLHSLRPDAGNVQVLGVNVRERPDLVRANVGYVPEQLDWGYGWMRVGRLLEHHARYFPTWDAAYAEKLSRAFDLRADQRMATLSKGQARRVHWVMALSHRPPLVILDEPTDGLDPMMRRDALGVLVDHLGDTPTAVLLATHHVGEVEQLADYVGVIDGGKLIAQLGVSELRQGLLRYRGEVPADWDGTRMFGDKVLSRSTIPKELD